MRRQLLKKTEKPMIRAMCGAKSIGKKSSQELMDSLSLEETLTGSARVSKVRWCGDVLRDGDDVLRRAIDVKVVRRRKRGEPKIT